MSEKRCVNCRAPMLVPFKVFQHEYDPCNRYKSRRKPIAWCRPCWERHAAQDAADKAAYDARNAAILADHLKRQAEMG